MGARCLLVFLSSVAGKLRNGASLRAFESTVRVLAGRSRAPVRPLAVLVVAAVVLAAFTIALASALRRGVTATCNCFGPARVPLGRRLVVRNVLLLAVVAIAATATPGPGPVRPGVLGVTALVAVGVTAFVVRLDDLVDLLFTRFESGSDR